MAAYGIKGAALLESGIHTLAEWSDRMVKEYGEQIRPHLDALWQKAQEHIGRTAPDTKKDQRPASDTAKSDLRRPDSQESPKGVPGESLVLQAEEGKHLTGTTEDSINHKVETYLLNPDHPKGGPKSVWFQKALGFSRRNSGDLTRQFVFDPKTAIPTVKTQYGQKFDQIIPIKGANGKVIPVEVTWIQNPDGVIRLVTVVPGNKKP